MKKVIWRVRNFFSVSIIISLILLIGACSPGGWGNPNPFVSPGKYVYVNNDSSTNYVSAFSINSDGTLSELTGSPYATGGQGGSSYYAANTLACAPAKKLLFVSNAPDNTVSVFSINATDGTLTSIGSPVPTGGTSESGSYGSLVVDSNENYLFVASYGIISVFSIGVNGTLTPVTGSPFNIGSASPDGICLNASGSVLYVTEPYSNLIYVFSIAADGSLSQITGSPFGYTAGGYVTSFALSSSTLGIAGAVDGILSSYSIATDGTPTQLHILNTGSINNQAVTIIRNGSIAILSGGQVNQISVVNVSTNGTLTQVSGSPFTTTNGTMGYAVANPTGTFLYATESNTIEGFSIDSNGALTSLGTYNLTGSAYAHGIVIY